MSTVDLKRVVARAPDATTSARTVLWRDLLTLTRPDQWPKNLLVVALPLLYPKVWAPEPMLRLGLAVVLFTIASAVVYICNDLSDRKRDQRHSLKQHRPLASGRLAPRHAVLLGAGILILLALLTLTFAPGLAWPIGTYLALNAAYSVGLRNVPMIDVFVVAFGFELRIVAGYLATGLPLRGWLLPSVFLLCLLLVLGKRRRELEQADPAHRPALRSYTTGLVDQLLILSAGLAAVTFLLFLNDYLTVGSDGGPSVTALALLPPALLGLFRYLQVVAVSGGGADPVRTLLRDWLIVADAVVCLLILLAMRFIA